MGPGLVRVAGMSEDDFAALQRAWFRRLTAGSAVTTAGFTALLAGLGIWHHVELLLTGAAIIGAVFVIDLVALALVNRGRLLLAAQLFAGAGVAHAIVQSYAFPFAAAALAVSVVLSVASVLPYVHGRPLRWLVASSVLSSLALAWLSRLSPLGGVVPAAAQEVIALAALPAATILTSLLLLQFSERSRFTREAEVAARRHAEQAHQALEEAGQRLRFALSAAHIGIWNVDLTTGTLDPDDRCRALFGFAAGEELAYPAFLGRVHADDRPRVNGTVQAALRGDRGGRYEIEYRALGLRDGVARWIRSTGQAVFERGRPVRLTGTAEDVTGAKESEADLHAAKNRAEEANRAKDEFLAMLGHELRNPLAPMLTALELLRVRLGEVGAREREIIQRQVQNLVQLVDDLIDVAQIRKGRITIEQEPLYVRQIVARALDAVAATLEQRRHRLQVDIQPPSLIVMGDEQRLVQAVTNLLTNAAKYTDPGGAIGVTVSVDAGEVQLAVRDSGRGMPPALLPRVFELFVQGERTPDRSEGGLGLGLAIVRSIVERHGGSVFASSGGPGRGSEFVIRLPTVGEGTPLPAARSLLAETPSQPPLRKVLIVDDNTDAADALCALLGDSGYSCETAFDGPSGLEAVTRSDPDVVLLDIGLPHMDGYEVARRIRRLPGGARKLIVAVTGYGQEQDRRRSIEAGFDAHLTKPVDVDQLLMVLRTAKNLPASEEEVEPLPSAAAFRSI